MIYKIKDIQRISKPVFDKYGVRKAILFGSYAKGYARETSDIDTCVDSGLHDYSFYGLYEDIQNLFSKDVELIDTFEIIKSSPIEKEISKTGKVIYVKK